MVDHSLDAEHGVLVVRPNAPLEKDDFVQMAKTVDPYIEKHGALAGLLIEAPSFPGWDSLGAMAAHFRFVRDHHRKVKRVALVTDSGLGNVAQHLASHFVSAEIRHFPANALDAARQWVAESGAK